MSDGNVAFVLTLDQPEEVGLLSERQFVELLMLAWQRTPSTRRPALPPASNRLAANLYVISDEQIAELNREHMQHEGPTDVLSFPMGDWDPEREAFLLGEIMVSYDTARREATARGLTHVNELARYVVHGFLHLVGYEDTQPSLAEEMHALQEEILKAWAVEEESS